MVVSNKKTARRSIYHVALVGMLAATIEVSKLVLAVLPNVEVVTLLCALYGYVFGWIGVAAALVFVAIEPLVWGMGTWVISYILYWPFVALAFWLLGRAHVRNRVLLTAVALAFTLWFSVLTSLVDIGLFSGAYNRFFYRFSIYYVRGIPYYAIQLVCNAVAFSLLFRPLADRLAKLRARNNIFKK